MKQILNFQLLAAFTGLLFFTPSRSMGQIYSWSFSGDMPVTLNHHSSIAYNGKVYLIGGGTDFSSCGNQVYEFDPTQPQPFTLKTPMPIGLCGAALAEQDGKIYVFGGYTVFGAVVTNKAFVYDVAGNKWDTIPPMPTARGYASASILYRKIYVLGGGGSTGASSTAVMERYDPLLNTWSPAPSMPQEERRALHTSHAYKHWNSGPTELYVFGGLQNLSDSVAQKTVLIYDVFGGWGVIDTMPTPRLFHASCELFGKIYLMGGYDYTGTPVLSSVHMYTPGIPGLYKGVWASTAPLLTPRRAHSASAVGNRIYAFGGNESVVYKSVEVTDAIVSSPELAGIPNVELQVRIAPNPTAGQTTVFYQLSTSGEITFFLYDSYGRQVRTRVMPGQAAGENSFVLDTSPLPKGMYWGVLRTEKGLSEPIRLMVQ